MAICPEDGEPRFETLRFASVWLMEVATNAWREARIAKAKEPTEKQDLVADLIAFSESLPEAAHEFARGGVRGADHGQAIHYLVMAHGTAKIRTKWKRLRALCNERG
jgi:hypothetical protein